MARRRRRRRNKSPIRQEYLKQRKRLGYYVTKMRKQGYDLSIQDLAGSIPKRVTKSRVLALNKIRSLEDAIKAFEKESRKKPIKIGSPSENAMPLIQTQLLEQDTTASIPSASDVMIENFHDDISKLHPTTQWAINKWEQTLIQYYGEDAFSEALEAAAEEGYSLSDGYGYMIPPEDLALYLWQVTRMISADGNAPSLQDALQVVEDVIQQYETYVESHGVGQYVQR